MSEVNIQAAVQDALNNALANLQLPQSAAQNNQGPAMAPNTFQGQQMAYQQQMMQPGGGIPAPIGISFRVTVQLPSGQTVSGNLNFGPEILAQPGALPMILQQLIQVYPIDAYYPKNNGSGGGGWGGNQGGGNYGGGGYGRGGGGRGRW